MPPKRFRSMTFTIVIVAMLCVAVVLPTAAVVTVAIIRDVLREDMVERTERVMDFNYQLVRFQLSRARLVVETFAADPSIADTLRNPGSSASELPQHFDEVLRILHYVENIVVQTTNCVVVSADSEFQAQIIPNFFSSEYCRGYGRDERTYVSGRFTSVLTGRPVMAMTVPVVESDGREIGLVTAIIDIGDLSLYLKNMQADDGFTAVLDRNGYVVIDTRLGENEQGMTSPEGDPILAAVAERLQGGAATSEVFAYETDDAGMMVSYQHYIADPGSFTVVNVEPQSLSYFLERRIALILGVAGAAMLVALIAALWLTVSLSTRRLNKMSAIIAHSVKRNQLAYLPNTLIDTNDEVGLLGSTFNDMVDRIHAAQDKLREAKAKSDAMLLGIGDGVLAIDKNARIIMFNRAAEHISGFTADDVLGKPYRQVLRFVRGADGKEVTGFVRKALGGATAVMPEDVSFARKDGSLVPVADSASPIMGADGSVAGAIIVFRDVTHEREVDRMKSEFVSVASHQLRTPLTAIRWSLEDLQSGEAGTLTDVQRENVTQAADSTTRMIRLVNDLLDVSRLESGRVAVHPEPTDVGELLAGVVQESAGIAKDKRCAVTLDLPETPLPAIHVDPVLVRQVAMNLVSNAIKYSSADDRAATVRVRLSQDGKHYYRVQVDDNGMGIAEAAQERIFQRFFRADEAVKQQAEGSGLGLYIAKLIIEASGGMISFSSTPGKGSAFWFLLPVSGSKERVEGKSLSSKH